MTKEEKAFVMAYGEALLIMEKRISNMIPKHVKYKVVRPLKNDLYIMRNGQHMVLDDLGFTREVSKVWG